VCFSWIYLLSSDREELSRDEADVRIIFKPKIFRYLYKFVPLRDDPSGYSPLKQQQARNTYNMLHEIPVECNKNQRAKKFDAPLSVAMVCRICPMKTNQGLVERLGA